MFTQTHDPMNVAALRARVAELESEVADLNRQLTRDADEASDLADRLDLAVSDRERLGNWLFGLLDKIEGLDRGESVDAQWILDLPGPEAWAWFRDAQQERERRKAQLIAAAKAKLTAEEREALGLRD